MTKKKVLIIDNCPLVLEMAKDFLNISGYEVHTATNGIEANQHIFSVLHRLVANKGVEGFICKPFPKYDSIGAVKKQLPLVSYYG